MVWNRERLVGAQVRRYCTMQPVGALVQLYDAANRVQVGIRRRNEGTKIALLIVSNG